MKFYMRITGSKQGRFIGNSTKHDRIGWIEVVDCAAETLAALGLRSKTGGTQSMLFTISRETDLSSPTFFRATDASGFQIGTGIGSGSGSTGGTGSGGGSGSGGGQGPIVVTKVLDSSSANFFRACASGEVLTEFLLDVTDTSGVGVESVSRRLSLVGARIVDIRMCLRLQAIHHKPLHDVFLRYQGFRETPAS